ncbi:hypothetical protein GOP47_0002466 [Adiantum capillus-veneris]|uniref:Uncharacterized protein n=1 Tax=Adiantum capillus-veneris TaxID=13818 RepID=A0A9D4VAN6_ADICA|nr:hypothetical protein GOP47_0002466 [Adiantum capillus-veneris]
MISNIKVQISTKLGNQFTLSKKRKVDNEVFKAVRQLDFDPGTFEKAKGLVDAEDVGMAIHILAHIKQFVQKQ